MQQDGICIWYIIYIIFEITISIKYFASLNITFFFFLGKSQGSFITLLKIQALSFLYFSAANMVKEACSRRSLLIYCILNYFSPSTHYKQ